MSGNQTQNGKRISMVVIALAVFVLLASVALVGGGKMRRVLSKTKLTSDVAILNSAAQSYQSRGGKFAPDETAGSVITILKSRDSNQRLPGFSGAIVDKKLIWKMQSNEEAASDNPRAIWNNETKRFEIVYQGDPGIASFTVDHSEAPLMAEGEQAEGGSAFEYSENSGWIWDYDDEAKKDTSATEPTKVNIGGTVTPTETSDWIPVSLEVLEGEEDHSRDLKSPIFSIPAGSYPVGDFDLQVALENPNSPGSSEIKYSVDYGPWKTFEGESISVQKGETLVAKSKSLKSKTARDSAIASATYVVAPPVEDLTETKLVSAEEEVQATPFLENRELEKTDFTPVDLVSEKVGPGQLKKSPETVTLSFNDERMIFDGVGNHYYVNIGETSAKMGLTISDTSTLIKAAKNSEVTGNGDACAFWQSSGLSSGSTTITMDISENPATAVNFKVYNVNVAEGGDRVTIRALTDRGTILADPVFTFAGNSPDGITYNPANGEANVAVSFTAPGEEVISSLTMKWEGNSPAANIAQSIGLGEITFLTAPEAGSGF